MIRNIFILLILSCAAFTASAQKGSKEIIVRTAVACDHCDACESCKGRVESALYKVKGVKLCEMNSTAQTIRVVYNPKKTNEDQIRQAICACGYEADGMKPTKEAYGKLDGCCRKQE